MGERRSVRTGCTAAPHPDHGQSGWYPRPRLGAAQGGRLYHQPVALRRLAPWLRSYALLRRAAAINAVQGDHSSPLVTLVAALVNVRVGWWLANPKYRRKEWKAKWA